MVTITEYTVWIDYIDYCIYDYDKETNTYIVFDPYTETMCTFDANTNKLEELI